VGTAQAVKLIIDESGNKAGLGFIPVELTVFHTPVAEFDPRRAGPILAGE
jgi:hypothetical protein